MARYHVSDGVARRCVAKPGNCRLGGAGEVEHYDSLEDANSAIERMNSREFGGSFGGVSGGLVDGRSHPNFGRFDEETSFDVPFVIDRDGNVVDAPGLVAPEEVNCLDGRVLDVDGYEAVTVARSGGLMDRAEFISGSGFEKYIRETPGEYVLTSVYAVDSDGGYCGTGFYDGEDLSEVDDGELREDALAGWALMRKKKDR